MHYRNYYRIIFLTHSDFKAYFGGLAECLGDLNDHDPRELVCGGCSAKERVQVCVLNPLVPNGLFHLIVIIWVRPLSFLGL